MSEITKHLEMVETYRREGNTKEAIAALLFLITKYAQKHDFTTAESLREKIISLDPMALSEAIRAQEIIDTAHLKPVDKGLMEIWSGLYDQLSVDEANALFNETHEVTFRPGQKIFEQGIRSHNLYFISAGQAKHLFAQGDREMFIKRVGPGNVAGEDTFFDASQCTSTLVAIDRVKANFISNEALKNWQGTVPELEGKLKTFCAKEEKINDLLKRNALDRRTQRRVNFPGRVLIKVVDYSGEPVGNTMQGKIGDVSTGGASFFIKAADREHAQMLLGNRLHLRFNMPPNMVEFERIGLALGVKHHDDATNSLEQYSVHIKFDKKLSDKDLSETERFLKLTGRIPQK
ncbi:MAG: cyclic nucleotide-binding domain-containing protein [Desulfobulbaceae bacterium]|nr:cyclic nucleotide-binding domain-containing protein [Desulfobulbaceae bacterium]